jgi:iron complex outermembrane receptor protein
MPRLHSRSASPRVRMHAPRAVITPVAAACAIALGWPLAVQAQQGVAPPAAAASAPAPAAQGAVQAVTITGIRRSLESSVTAKRESDGIVEVVSAEDIGKLPDTSIAESLARLPGLTGQRGPDGRVNVISIRGLSPEFAGALLNGREVVSSNDSRAVEYDQFPSELIGQAIVHKTPSANLMGQGLAGTVDLRARRPLDTRGREIAINLRADRNDNGNLAPGVADPTGKRFSIAYVDQFANNTIGVALGYARLDVTTNMKLTELVEYGDYSPFGLPVAGNVPSQFPYGDGTATGQAMLPMFWTATSSTKRNLRDGFMAVLEYKPNADLRSQLDLYYSKFDTHEVGGKFLQSLFASWGQFFGAGVQNTLSEVGTTQIGRNTYATSALASALPVTTGNFDTRRKDRISALGWNTELNFAERWKAGVDLSYSRDERDEQYSEAYAAPYDRVNNGWQFGAFRWNVPVDGSPQTYTPVQPDFLANPSTIALGDVIGFDFVPGQPRWAGAVRTPHIEDEVKSIKLSLQRSLDGMFSAVQGGVNHTTRDKLVQKNESRLLMAQDGNGANIRDIPAAALRTPFDMAWAGIPQLVRFDVPSLVSTGAVSLQPGRFTAKVDNDSGVQEEVTTLFGMLNIDTALAGIPIRGNIGAQYVRSKQSSQGFEYRGNDDNPDINLLFARTGGASYSDFLPSLNLVAEIRPDFIARFGLGESTARPNIVDMRAGTSTPTLITGEGPDQGKWNIAYSGNPELKPWRAAGIDLSLEKYFGKRSYVSFAAFRKNLLNYITYGISARDNSDVPIPPDAPEGIVVQRFGPVLQPLNGSGGKVEGLELAAALEFNLLHPALDGFGIVASGSKLSSSIRDQQVDPNTGRVIPGATVSLNGLSGRSNSVTLYYEKYGFAARVSQRYRSAFTATTRDIYLNSTTRQQAADKVVDLQLGYNFEEAGLLKGLSVLLQVNNVTDTKPNNLKSVTANAPDATQLTPNYTYQFGRQTLLGVNYKF